MTFTMIDTLKKILEHTGTSTSRIVFLLMAVISCVAFLMGYLGADQFMVLVSMAFGYYFRKDGADQLNDKLE